jgi:UTP:GlnB (protein PII) uridylyltransferase
MTDDPSLVDTGTLIRSARRDIDEAFRWLVQARVTLHQLQRRAPNTLGSNDTSLGMMENEG